MYTNVTGTSYQNMFYYLIYHVYPCTVFTRDKLSTLLPDRVFILLCNTMYKNVTMVTGTSHVQNKFYYLIYHVYLCTVFTRDKLSTIFWFIIEFTRSLNSNALASKKVHSVISTHVRSIINLIIELNYQHYQR